MVCLAQDRPAPVARLAELLWDLCALARSRGTIGAYL